MLLCKDFAINHSHPLIIDTYKSCRPDSRPEHKIKIHVRNISWLPLRKSLVKELVGNIYDRDQVKLGVDKDKKDQEKRFSHSDQSRTIKWTVDQRDGMVQLYTYDISMSEGSM